MLFLLALIWIEMQMIVEKLSQPNKWQYDFSRPKLKIYKILIPKINIANNAIRPPKT